MAVDVSYRNTGVAIISKSNTLSLCHSSCISNPVIGYGFDGYLTASINMQNTCAKLFELSRDHFCDIVVCEMPTYGRSMNAGMAIGISWGSMTYLDPVFIPPSHLKKWSNSKKGDGKKTVRAVVESRVYLDSYTNDNIVDAVGTALMISDMISELKNKKQT